MSGQMTLVLGGAASGKSAHAEKLVLKQGDTPTYIATAQAFDAEMEIKIARHIEQRGPSWTTHEAPVDVSTALGAIRPAHPVLIDCATLWLSNLMLGDHDIDAATDALLQAIAACPAPVTIVTNEVGQGIVPQNAMSRQFRELQGRLNIRLAAQADHVVQVIVGLPQTLKGDAT